MEHYAGIDVSLELSGVCIVDTTGRIIREAKVASEPEALITWFCALGLELTRIGLEAGPLSQWLYAAMRGVGLPVELLETWHVRDAFKAMPVKTDRNDARGIAQLMRLGWFRPVHCKSVAAQETRALLTARKLLQTKHHDVELSLRGILRGFGRKVGPTTGRRFAGRIRELVDGHPTLSAIAEALLAARAALGEQLRGLDKRLRDQAREDQRARLLMSAPGVGVIVAQTFVSAIDDPGRFRSSKAVGAHFGLTPRKYQSGETDVTGRISKIGDATVRTVLYEAANIILTRAGEGLFAQELGDAPSRPGGDAQGEGGAGAQAGCGAAPHAGGRNNFCRDESRGSVTAKEKRQVRTVNDISRPQRSPIAGTMDQVRP
jgi:transposase